MKNLIILAAFALASCSDTGAMGMKGSTMWLATAQPEEMAAYYGARCEAFGYQHGTPEFSQCIQYEMAGDRSSNQANQAVFNAIGNSYPAPTYTPTTTTNCTTHFGNTTCRTY